MMNLLSGVFSSPKVVVVREAAAMSLMALACTTFMKTNTLEERNARKSTYVYVLYLNWNRILLQIKFHKCHSVVDMHRIKCLQPHNTYDHGSAHSHTHSILIGRCTPMQYSETSLIQHLYNPTFSLIRP